jgi:hypothetical protein
LSVLRTGRTLLPRNIFLLLVLISVTRLSEPQGLVRPEIIKSCPYSSFREPPPRRMRAVSVVRKRVVTLPETDMRIR